MVVECLVHMAQSTWNGSGMDGPYGTVHIAQSTWNGGGMHCPYETVHMEWWWNALFIWNSPYGMVVEWMVNMAQSIRNGGGMHHMAQSIWNGGGMSGPYGTVHMEWW